MAVLQSLKDLTNVTDNKNASTASCFGKGIHGKCYLKMYQGHLVVAKEFLENVTPSEVMKEANMLATLSHAGILGFLGVDFDAKTFDNGNPILQFGLKQQHNEK